MAEPLGLRVDVDFAAGLERAVPRMLDRLNAAGFRATFFVVAGRNRPAGLLRRLAEPGYARRLVRLGPLSVARGLGGSLAGDGRFLASPAHRRVLRRIVDEGHELAVHGHDHAWWADRVWEAPPEALVAEIERAFAAMAEASGSDVVAWASPAWRTRDEALRHLAGRGVPYLADCLGDGPFVTVDAGGNEIAVPHLSVTRPSVEGAILEGRLGSDAAVERAVGGDGADGARGDDGGVACVHDYYEGLMRPDLFERLIAACRARGVCLRPLREIAETLRHRIDALPRRRIVRGRTPGFHGEVSVAIGTADAGE